MGYPPRLLFGRSKVTTLFALALCLAGILVINLHGSSDIWSIERLRSKQKEDQAKSGPLSLKCGVEPHPGIPPKERLTELWTNLRKTFEEYPPILDAIDDRQRQSPLKYDRLEPVLPSSTFEATKIRTQHSRLLESLPREPSSLFHGRGIVMVIPSGSRSEFAATSLYALRLLGSKLPIELWFPSPLIAKPNWCATTLSQEGITCRFLSDYIPSALDSSTFPYEDQYKTTALLLSSFREILYLDPETIPTTNPDPLFSTPQYTKLGLVTWPDFWPSSEHPWAPYTISLIPEAVPQAPLGEDLGSIDAAQFLINKSTHYPTLLLLAYYTHFSSFFQPLLSTQAPQARGFGACLAFAVLVLQAPSYHVPDGPAQISRSASALDGSGTGSGVCVLHFDPADPNLPSNKDPTDSNSNSNPPSQHKRKPIFLHTSILRFGIRSLMCDTSCIETPSSRLFYSERHSRPPSNQRLIGSSVRTLGSLVESEDLAHDALVEGRKVLSWLQLAESGVKDLEGMIWGVMERVACEEGGVWMEGSLCANVRGYVERTLGDENGEGGWREWRGGCG